jgi:phytoene desaturase
MSEAVVIGAGFGGLAIANRLLSNGLGVTLLEKRDRVGGRAYQIRRDGYTFDTGPSLITAPSIIEDVFEQAASSLSDHIELLPLDPFYRVHFHDGSSIDYVGNAEDMKAQMRRFSPADADRYDDFMRSIRPIYDAVIKERLGAQPFDTIGAMVGFLPRVLRLGAFKPVARYASRFFRDFRHQFLFSFHPLFIGGNPFRVPSIYIMIPYLEREEGVWFTPGGMYSLVEAMEKLFVSRGGRVVAGSAVSSIETEGRQARAVVAGARRYPADIVVSNVDVAHMYGDLVRSASRRHWTDRRVSNLRQSMSCFLLYLGVRGQYPQLAHHTLILSHRYRELIEDIFASRGLPDDFSMYLHVPTRTDPGMAPDGCESIYVLVPVSNLKSNIDWEETGPRFAERVLTFLEKWGLKDLRRNLEVQEMMTPNDFATELNAAHGNACGIEPILSQTAYFRPHNRSEDFDNLYLVGAGTHPGAGVPGVLLSAEATEVALRRDGYLPGKSKIKTVA